MSPQFPFMHVNFFVFMVVGLVGFFLKTSAFCGNDTGGCINADSADSFGYPFSYYGDNNSDCGYPGLTLSCSNVKSRSLLNISNSHYYILSNYPEGQMLRVVGVDVDEEKCPRPMHNFTLPTTSPFSDPYRYNANITYFYNCSSGYPKDVVQQLPCLDAYYNSTATPGLGPFVFSSYYRYYNPGDSFNWFTRNCQESVVVPVQYVFNSTDLKTSLKWGFQLIWSNPEECKNCEKSGGQCWHNQTTHACSCKQGTKTRIVDTVCHHVETISPEQECKDCEESGGHCFFNQNATVHHACSCPQNSTVQTKLFDKVCPLIQNTSQQQEGATDISQHNHQTGIRTELKIIIGVCSGVGGILLIILFIYRQKLSSLYASIVSNWKHKIIKTPTNVKAFLEKGGGLGLQKYSYSQIKKMTNSFKETLGEGGFGSVFKGKLRDGRLVAVKVLNESKGKGDDFINEVATIGRTNHVNVVSLLGFCSTGPKQALVYEFMPNGSLEKFIYNRKNASITNPPLGWEKLYQIALGIAKGLKYLHCGCNTRILHFDIKPHNILLDQDFCPKISDFGLAKLCQARESNVSMNVARGTMGYIAPEVSCINFGRVSHKSDVYSYGMMVFEMIGGRKNIDTSVENISEIYFPQWIYSHFKQDIDIDECREIFKEETTRKMIKVALWCIQPQPADRPSISKVVEMLEGNVDELEMPPNPFQDCL